MMSSLSAEEKDGLADVQCRSLEVYKTPVTDYDITQKSYVDSKFAAAVTSSTAAVTALIDGAPAQLNTLREISSALLDNANLGSVLTAQISAVSASVTAEAASRVGADTVINGTLLQHGVLIQNETNSRVGAVAGVNALLQNEIGDRGAGDVALQGIINTDRSAALLRDNALGTRVTEETAARELRDGQLQASITTEEVTRQLEITGLAQSKLDMSPYYSGGSESHFTISEGAYLYIGPNWRIAASITGQAKRLVFEHNSGAFGETWKTAVPFVRPAPQ